GPAREVEPAADFLSFAVTADAVLFEDRRDLFLEECELLGREGRRGVACGFRRLGRAGAGQDYRPENESGEHAQGIEEPSNRHAATAPVERNQVTTANSSIMTSSRGEVNRIGVWGFIEEHKMNWQDRISLDPKVLVGKP